MVIQTIFTEQTLPGGDMIEGGTFSLLRAVVALRTCLNNRGSPADFGTLRRHQLVTHSREAQYYPLGSAVNRSFGGAIRCFIFAAFRNHRNTKVTARLAQQAENRVQTKLRTTRAGDERQQTFFRSAASSFANSAGSFCLSFSAFSGFPPGFLSKIALA